jgi:hypothetical protein
MPILAALPSLATMMALMFYPDLVSYLIFSPVLTVFALMIAPISSAVYKNESNRTLIWSLSAALVIITLFGGTLLPNAVVVFSKTFFEIQDIIALSLMIYIPALTAMSLYKRRLDQRHQIRSCHARCELK